MLLSVVVHSLGAQTSDLDLHLSQQTFAQLLPTQQLSTKCAIELLNKMPAYIDATQKKLQIELKEALAKVTEIPIRLLPVISCLMRVISH